MPPVNQNPCGRAVLGCIQIPTDYVLDKEGPRLVDEFPGVELRLQKMVFASDNGCKSDGMQLDTSTFQRNANNIAVAGKTLLPIDRCTVIGMACTSLSFTLGPDHIDKQLGCVCPGVKTTDMARAQAKAIAAIGAKKVALLTPYITSLADKNKDMLEAGGDIIVVRRATMELERDELTSAVSKATISAWAEAVDCDECDAVVIGCSAFRACEYGFIDELELLLGKPVITSTQSFMWSMLRTAGINDQINGYGKLFNNC